MLPIGRPASKAGPRLRTVVEPENRLDHTVPFGGQIDSARPSSIGAAGVGHLMQLHPEGCAELRHRARQDHGAARRMLLQHLEPVGLGEGAHLGEIRRIRAVLARELFPAQMRDFACPRASAARRDCIACWPRRRTSTLTSSRSAGLAGATTRAPETAARSLPFNNIFAMAWLLDVVGASLTPLRHGRAAVADRRIRMRAVPGQVSWVRAPRRPAVRLPVAPAAAPARRSSSPRSCAESPWRSRRVSPRWLRGRAWARHVRFERRRA